MILEGVVEKKDNYFGVCNVDGKLYEFPLCIVYGSMIDINDHVKIRIENNIPKIVTKYEIIELEEFLNVD